MSSGVDPIKLGIILERMTLELGIALIVAYREGRNEIEDGPVWTWAVDLESGDPPETIKGIFGDESEALFGEIAAAASIMIEDIKAAPHKTSVADRKSLTRRRRVGRRKRRR